MDQAGKMEAGVERLRRLLVILVCGAGLGIGGCRAPAREVTKAVGSGGDGVVQTYSIRGKIVSVDAAEGSVMLDHEAVPGYMSAMTMSYKLADPGVVGELHPGDRVTAKLLVSKGGAYKAPTLDQFVVVAQARPDYKPPVDYHVPTAGDAVPDFKLLNQSGKTISLAQFKGRVLLLTFVYTRCPLADYCPRMSRNFAEIDKALAADPAVYGRTHLLSISFDPEYDTPAVLTSYGGAYTGQYTKERFAHWDFAVPPAGELKAVTQYFNVGITPSDPGQIQHSLSTVLIGRDGKVVAWYPTNDWKVEDVVAAIKAAAV